MVESGSTPDNGAYCHTAITTFLRLIVMTKKGCKVCWCPRLLCLVGVFHHLGLGTLELHSFDLSFHISAPEAVLTHQAPGLGLPKGQSVLRF